MKKVNVRSLHLNTSSIVREVEEGETYVVEKRGIPVAQLKPGDLRPAARRMPNRDRILAKFPEIAADSGRFLEEDRK